MSTEPMSKEYIVAVLKEAFKANPRRRPKPVLAVADGAEVEHVQTADEAKPTVAVIETAIAHNRALARRLETAACRHNLDDWQQSILDVQRAVVRRRKEPK
jgi:hypothetical protein